MIARMAWWLALAAGLVLWCQPARGEEKRAAIVNGEVVPEKAVQRALKAVPPEHKLRARQEILSFLIDNVLIEQHLVKAQVDAPKQEVESRVEQVKKEVKAQGQEFDKILEQLMLTEEELRVQITADLRWDNYVKKQAGDPVLAELFKNNRNWFDGSQVRARHILAAVAPDADAKTREGARAKLATLKTQLEAQVEAELAKVDAKADNLAREEARLKAVTEAFAEAAKNSDCPSSKNGGDLGAFPRIGSMVEPFAKAAFALAPGRLSDIVETEFGYHLILVTAQIPGKEIKFDDVKDEVREIYAERLRVELVPQLRKAARIEIVEPK